MTPVPAIGAANGEAAGTVNVELGGLARTDNSGWGDEFERLTERLLAGHDSRQPPRERVP